MSPALAIAVGLLSGAAVGALYFLWLWRNLRGLESRRHRAAWIAAGFVGRLAFALACFALLARWGGWPALAAALVGWLAARTLLVRRLRAPRSNPGTPA